MVRLFFVSLWFKYAVYFDQLLGAVGVQKLVEILAFSVFRRLWLIFTFFLFKLKNKYNVVFCNIKPIYEIHDFFSLFFFFSARPKKEIKRMKIKKVGKWAKKSILTSFWVYAALKSWSKYTTATIPGGSFT